MAQITNFHALIKIILSGEVSDEDGYLVSKIPMNSLDVTEAKETLLSLGYLRSESCITDSENHYQLYISRQADSWIDGLSPIYLNEESFWQQNGLSDKLPENYFIIEENSFSCTEEKHESVYKFESVFAWKTVIELIADHNQNNKSIFFIVDEKGYKTFEIPLNPSYSEVSKIPNNSKNIDSASHFLNLIEVNDPHQKERISVVKTALTEFLDSDQNHSCALIEIIKNHEVLHKKYDSLYDIYVKRFSINKILNELDEKGLEFTSKINEFISSSQTKAIAIPSALIAIGALSKASGFVESLLIAFGLLLVKKITKTTNDVFRESFDFLDKRIKKAFKKYLKFDEGKEVKDSATGLQVDLEQKISTAKERLNTIDKYANHMLWVGMAYLIIKYLYR